MNTLTYKGFDGTAELDVAASVCCGKILFIDDLITYESDSVAGLKTAFEEAVDDYISTCEMLGRPTQQPCRGQFNVRISPELHRAAVLRGQRDGLKLNGVVIKALEAYLDSAPAAVNLSVNFYGQEHQSDPKVIATGLAQSWGVTSAIASDARH